MWKCRFKAEGFIKYSGNMVYNYENFDKYNPNKKL